MQRLQAGKSLPEGDTAIAREPSRNATGESAQEQVEKQVGKDAKRVYNNNN